MRTAKREQAHSRDESGTFQIAALAKAPVANRIEEANANLTRVLSHNLKTSLGAISLNLEYLAEELGATLKPELREVVDDCLAAVMQAAQMIRDATAAQQAAALRATVHSEVFPMEAMLGRLVERSRPTSSAMGVRMFCHAEPAVVRADEELVERAFERLFDWVFERVSPGASISIESRERVVTMRIPSGDDGLHVGAGAVRSALSTHLAEAAIRSQGGALWVESRPDGVTCVCVVLPGE